MQNQKTNLLKLSILGAIMFLASSLMARSLVLPVAGDLFEDCSETGLFASSLEFGCSTTPFLTIGLVGAIIFLISLRVVASHFNIKKKGYFWVFLSYLAATLLLSIFWRDVLIFSDTVGQLLPDGVGLPSDLAWRGEPLVIDETTLSQVEDGANVSKGYAYLYLWLNIVAGMIIGSLLHFLNRKSVSTKSEHQPIKTPKTSTNVKEVATKSTATAKKTTTAKSTPAKTKSTTKKATKKPSTKATPKKKTAAKKAGTKKAAAKKTAAKKPKTTAKKS